MTISALGMIFFSSCSLFQVLEFSFTGEKEDYSMFHRPAHSHGNNTEPNKDKSGTTAKQLCKTSCFEFRKRGLIHLATLKTCI